MPRDVLWRIARRPHALDRSGAGARLTGGRWNLPGTPVIYASRSVAIAALERFVHVANVPPADLVLVRVELPAGYSAEAPAIDELPRDWHAVPPAPGSMNFGTAWARSKRSLVLYVPSVIVPEEPNALLNPAHRQFRGVTMAIARAFRYDVRLT